MAETTRIEWCDATWNPWIGCTKISPACDHCYASVSTPARSMRIVWGAGQSRHRTSAGNWKLPERWNKQVFAECPECGWRGEQRNAICGCDCPSCMQPGVLVSARRRVFCASLADVFDNEVPAQWRIGLMKLICETPHLDWLLLTKRIGNASAMLETAFRAVHHQREGWADNIPPNVWIGATICNQEEADRDIPKLLTVPAVRHFLSMEPLLGPVQLPEVFMKRLHFDGKDHDYPDNAGMINWVIVGGESGHKARPMHPDWAYSLQEQCKESGVPFFMKQMTKKAEIPADLMTRWFPQ